MAIPFKTNSLEGIDEKYHDLYEETTPGEFVLTGAETKIADVQKLEKALKSERELHAEAKRKLQEKSQDKSDTAKEDKPPVSDKSDLVRLQRELEATKNRLNEMDQQNKQLAEERKSATILEQLRSAAVQNKVKSAAVEDVLLYKDLFELTEDGKVLTKEGVNVTDGITPTQWLQEIAPKKEYWFSETAGGGAQGSTQKAKSTTVNPWAKETFNLTEQGKLLRSQPDLAARLKKAAGK